MASARTVILFAVAATIAMIFLSPVVTAVNDSTGTQSVTNESVTADVGSYVELGGFNVVDGSETVYAPDNRDNGEFNVTSEGADYEINNSDGSIKALSGSSEIDDGDTLKVTYDYEAAGQITTTVVGFVPVMIGAVVLFMLGQGVQREM